MQGDFHYYATYCAAYIAGCTHAESRDIAYCSQFTDHCTKTLLKKLKGPLNAATTQMQTELINVRSDVVGLQDITRIWASFHFLPYDLNAKLKGLHLKRYMNRYRLICKPNGPLVEKTVELAKGQGVQAAGLAMHVLADTWAHSYFAGTPSNVINNTNSHFFEIRRDGGNEKAVRIAFRHNPAEADDPEHFIYSCSVHQEDENSIMNLGHGRAGHFPDYSYARYKYLPAWGDYEEIYKDNPGDYFKAFSQMVRALKYLRGELESFSVNEYADEALEEYKEKIMSILEKRQTDASKDWKAFALRLSGHELEPFSIGAHESEYLAAAEEEKDASFLGRYFIAALAQKSMVTHEIFESGSLIAGFSVDYRRRGLAGISDFWKVIADRAGRRKK